MKSSMSIFMDIIHKDIDSHTEKQKQKLRKREREKQPLINELETFPF